MFAGEVVIPVEVSCSMSGACGENVLLLAHCCEETQRAASAAS